MSRRSRGAKKARPERPEEEGSKNVSIAEAVALLRKGMTSVPARPNDPIHQPLENSPQQRRKQGVREKAIKLSNSARQLERATKSAFRALQGKVARISALLWRIFDV